MSLAPLHAVDVVASYGDLCGECPLWDSENQILYWADIARKKLYGCEWPARKHGIIHEGLEISGIAQHQSAGFVIVNSGGVWIWNPDGTTKLVVESVSGRRCVLNDCIADPAGRLFTGSCFYAPSTQDYERGCLFRIDVDGSAAIVDEGFGISNGLALSLDCSTLYFVDSAERTIYAYDYRVADGSVRNRRVFVKTGAHEGIPDGLTVDSEGFLWSAQWFGGCIVRYDPDGREQMRITVPATQTSSLTFGGPSLTDIFVTSAAMPDALPFAPPGYRTQGVHSGGQLYHLRAAVPGREEYVARIDAPVGLHDG